MRNATEQNDPKSGVPSPDRLGSTGYTAYREVEAAGSRIGVMTCLRCGATVVIDPGDLEPATAIHDRWHSLMSGGLIACG